MYTYEDYIEELRVEDLKKYPPIKYKFQRRARKTHMCEMCGSEIHPNEYYWSYKPNPTYNLYKHKREYDKWRKRCIRCEPLSHEELKSIKEE